MGRTLAAVLLSLLAVPASAVAAWHAAALVRGSNVSDVGVPIYAHRSLALATGLVLFPVLCALLLLGIRYALARGSVLPFAVGLPTFVVALIPYLWLLRWTYA